MNNSLIIKTILAIHVSNLPSNYVFTGDEAECFMSDLKFNINNAFDDMCGMSSTVFVAKHGMRDGNDTVVFAASVAVEGACNSYKWLYTNDRVKCRLFSDAIPVVESSQYHWIPVAGIVVLILASTYAFYLTCFSRYKVKEK